MKIGLKLSLISNVVLFLAASYLWFMNANAIDRVKVLFAEPPRKFSISEEKFIMKVRPIISEYLGHRLANEFYVHEIESKSGTNTVHISWLSTRFDPEYELELDGRTNGHYFIRDNFTPCFFDFDDNAKLLYPNDGKFNRAIDQASENMEPMLKTPVH